MHDANIPRDNKIHFWITRGINNVVTLLLKLGRHHKFNDTITDPTKWLSMQTTRKVIINKEFEYFKHLIKYLLQNDKVRGGTNDILDDSLDFTQDPITRTATINTNLLTPTTISTFAENDSPLAKSGSPIGKINTQNFQLNPSALQDEPQWHIKDHKAPDGETILKAFGKLLFAAADPQVNH